MIMDNWMCCFRLQESQRKIDSVIVFEENRAVAKTNYIVKKRKIHYLNPSEANCFKEI